MVGLLQSLSTFGDGVTTVRYHVVVRYVYARLVSYAWLVRYVTLVY